MWAKARNWLLGAVLFLGSLAMLVLFNQRRRADKAQEKIQQGKEDDAAQAERRKMNAGELARLKEAESKIPTESPARTPDQVTEELRRRGHVK